MNDGPAARRAAEARALTATLAIAGLEGWSLRGGDISLNLPFSHYLYVEAAELLLVPTIRPLPAEMKAVTSGTRIARSDALIVRVDPSEPFKVELAFGLWGRDATRWLAPMALWQRSDVGTWLVPSPYFHGLRDECFALRDGRLRPGPAPWRSEAEMRVGCMNVAVWLSRMLSL